VRVAVERIRSSVHEIKSSGLTLSKLSVAASLLGDLARD
jgi:glutamate dehydrogenase